jgi:hypothetical protein
LGQSPFPPSDSDEGNGSNGYLIGNMMSKMMMQNRMDTKQRGQQYKNETEQREREVQLWHEEMAIMQEESLVQRQMMNLMLLAMLNRNGGDNSNPPPSPSNT